MVYKAVTPSLVKRVVTIFGWIMFAAVETRPALKNVPTMVGEKKTVQPVRQQRLSVKKVRNKVEIWLFYIYLILYKSHLYQIKIN